MKWELAAAAGQSGAYAPLRERLRAQAEEIGSRFGIDTTPVVVPGFPHQKLIDHLASLASEFNADLLVVGTNQRASRD